MLLDDGESARSSLDSSQADVKIHVPFKYDLGGRVRDASGIRSVLMNLYGNVEVDQATVHSWNLSYLACHPVVLRSRLPGGTAKIAGSEWYYERSLRLFPWLGALSVDYEFKPKQAHTNILTFYDGLVEWKNVDYLPYLKKCGAMTQELAQRT